ncbi:hypothetical protein H6F61_08440 [Cyanobacteria bacterium FACHB-472]|nr:hypothetical protein [Cyanobacteria bacterium FACHB-472]
MTSTQDSAAVYVVALLVHYCFELGGYKPEELVTRWLQNYAASWVRFAVIEALYQGRYKAVSVEQILSAWTRRGRALYHFNHDFERLISRNFPQNLLEPVDTVWEIASDNAAIEEAIYSDSTPPEDAIALTASGEVKIPVGVTEMPPAETPNLTEAATEGITAGLARRPDTRIVRQADWTRWSVGKRPIHQFIPQTDDSDFYQKLKAVAHNDEDDASKSDKNG